MVITKITRSLRANQRVSYVAEGSTPRPPRVGYRVGIRRRRRTPIPRRLKAAISALKLGDCQSSHVVPGNRILKRGVGCGTVLTKFIAGTGGYARTLR